MVATLGLSSVASAQTTTDVLVQNGAGTRSRPTCGPSTRTRPAAAWPSGSRRWSEAASRSCIRRTSSASTVRQVRDHPADGPERVVRIGRVRVHRGSKHHRDGHQRDGLSGGITTVTFATTGGTASIFYDSSLSGGSNRSPRPASASTTVNWSANSTSSRERAFRTSPRSPTARVWAPRSTTS